MIIKNNTKNKVLSNNARLCSSVLSKTIGLMFSLNKNTSLIFQLKKEKMAPLHMFFVFYPIDVIFLNKKKKIVELKKNFLPFTIYSPKNKAMYVLEVPKGTIEKTNSKISDWIEF